jgi:cobalt-zinc-cadmium efflux system protein
MSPPDHAHGASSGATRDHHPVRGGHQSHSHLGEHQDGDSAYGHHSHTGGTRPLAIAVVLTFGYALVEVAGGLWSGSLALLADAGHMATDSAALLFALAANVIARRPVSDRHSFGLARIEVIAAFVNALAMLAVVAWIFFEAFDRITAPVPVKGLEVFGIAAIGLAVNVVVAWTLSRDRENVNTRAAFLHVLGDLLGSVAAIAAGLIIYFGGPTLVDPLLSMLVGGLILRSTAAVLRETTLVLLDSVPQNVDYAAVGKALAQLPGIVSVHDLHVWAMVPGRSALSAHVMVNDIEQWPVVLHRARTMLKREFQIDHVTLQPEWLRRESPAQMIPLERHAD